MSARGSLLLAVFTVGLLHANPARAESKAPSASDVERAEQLFHKGTEAFEAARYSEAYGALRSAWDLSPSYRNAAGLGQVELHLTQYRDAAEHLAFCLRNYPAGGDESVRKHVEEGLTEAREHVAALRVRVDPEGAEVAVDGRSAGRAPLEALVFVEPGSHVVEASANGRAAAKETVDAPVRATRDVSLVLAPSSGLLSPGVASSSAPLSASDAARVDPGAGRSPSGPSATIWAVIIGGSLTAVAVGTAVAFDVMGAAANHDLKDLDASIGNGVTCTGPLPAQPPICSRIRDSADERNRDNTIALVAGISAGVLGAATAGTAIFLETSRDSRKKTAGGVFMGFGAMPGGAAVVLHGVL